VIDSWASFGIVRFALRLPHTFYALAAVVIFLGADAVLTDGRELKISSSATERRS
jgi:hypothetical protein